MSQQALIIAAGVALLAVALLSVLAVPTRPDGELTRLAEIVAAMVGLALLAVGLRRALGAARGSGPRERDGRFTDIELRAMVRAMVAVAGSDADIDRREVEVIRRTFHDLTGDALEPALLETVRGEALAPGYSVVNDLKLRHSHISPPMRELILRACCAVSFADGAVRGSEVDRLGELATILGIDGADFHRVMNEARDDYITGREVRAKPAG